MQKQFWLTRRVHVRPSVGLTLLWQRTWPPCTSIYCKTRDKCVSADNAHSWCVIRGLSCHVVVIILLDCWNTITQVFQEPQPEYIQKLENSVNNSSSFLFPKNFALYLSTHHTPFFFPKGLVKLRQKVVFLGAAFICFFSMQYFCTEEDVSSSKIILQY